MNTKQSYFGDASKIKKNHLISFLQLHIVFFIPGFNEFSRLYVLDSHADRYFRKLLKKKKRKENVYALAVGQKENGFLEGTQKLFPLS